MGSRVVGSTTAGGRLFRELFTFGSDSLTHWFPSHMAKSFKKMQAQMKKVDLVVEIHDARIPFTGRNEMMREALSIKPHLLVLNKKDLCDMSKAQAVKTRLLEEEGIKNVLYTNCVKQHSDTAKKVIPKIEKILKEEARFNRSEEHHYTIMVTGVPNVGKSSLINAMRRLNIKKGKAARVGKMPGVTRSVMNRILVSASPPMWLLDTPGILTPYVKDVETGMNLAVCGTLLDYMVGDEIIADYLLYTLNQYNKLKYCKVYDLDGPCDDIFVFLAHIAKKEQKTIRVKTYQGSMSVRWNINSAAVKFIRDFRDGQLGTLTLL
ncbi:mitochondrial ribosome-associated GTPase 1-like isoform X2 [Amphiura filiformis]